MIPLPVRVLLVFAVVFGQQQPRDVNAPRAGTAVLAGVVVTNDKDAQPIRRARITLNGDVRFEGQVATSDDAGRFVFRGVAGGRYTLQATKPPFLPTSYGASRPDRPGTPVVVAEGQAVSNLIIRLMRGAVLEGRVLDQNGEPIPGAAVAAVRNVYSPQSGERIPTVVATVVTDDRGVYRAFGLTPGEYVVLARPVVQSGGRESAPPTRRLTAADVDRVLQSAKAPESSRVMPGASVTWSPVYYPGTAELGGADRIRLEPGEERLGLDVTMRLVPTSRISGIVTTPPGVPPSAVRLTIVPAGGQVRLITEPVYVGMIRDPVTEARLSSGVGFVTAAQPAADGSYAFVGIPAGSYVVKARTGRAGALGRGGVQSASTEPMLWASANVTAQGADVDLPLALQTAIPVSGRVQLKTATPASPQAMAGLRLTLRVGDGGPGSTDQTSAQVTDRGTFAFEGAVPESYRFAFTRSAGPELFPTSLTIRGREMLDGPIGISAPVDDMIVTFTDRPSEITGTLEDTTGRPATDYFIVVFPTNRAYWTPASRRIMQTRAASDGKYILRNLPAGEYFLAALTDLAPGDTSDPAYLAEMSTKAAKVTVSDGAATVQSFRIGG